MPSKANPDKQNSFVNDVLNPKIKQAREGVIELFFMDASHFVMGGLPSRVWSKVRKWVRTSSGRKRYNVLGAVNFASKKIETIKNDSYITSTQVIELLEDIAKKYAGKAISIVLDNASYQRAKIVQAKAKQLNIELLFLPTYSPNLNLIERVWKLVKSRVLNAAYIETFESYRSLISDFVDSAHIDLPDVMDSLVSGNFQTFDNISIL
jgi:transposase